MIVKSGILLQKNVHAWVVSFSFVYTLLVNNNRSDRVRLIFMYLLLLNIIHTKTKGVLPCITNTTCNNRCKYVILWLNI